MPKSPPNVNPLGSVKAYEQLVYGLPDSFPSIQFSTLVFVRTSLDTAQIEGELQFADEIVLRVMQFVDFHEKTIRQYSYELYQRSEKLWWYDPWPHPRDKKLASTHPHHKHIRPDIKRNRIPAPGLSFERPNLPVLIREIETLLTK